MADAGRVRCRVLGERERNLLRLALGTQHKTRRTQLQPALLMPRSNCVFQLRLRAGGHAQRFQNGFLGLRGGDVQPSKNIPILRLDFPQNRRFIEGLLVG